MLPPEWQPKVSFPVILGTDVSGIVEAIAGDVHDFSAGDEVYSMVRFPSGLVMAGEHSKLLGVRQLFHLVALMFAIGSPDTSARQDLAAGF